MVKTPGTTDLRVLQLSVRLAQHTQTDSTVFDSLHVRPHASGGNPCRNGYSNLGHLGTAIARAVGKEVGRPRIMKPIRSCLNASLN